MKNRILEIKNTKGITIGEISKNTGMSKRTIYKALDVDDFEMATVSLGTFVRLANYLGVTLTELLDCESEKIADVNKFIEKNSQKVIKDNQKQFEKNKEKAVKKVAEALGVRIEIKK